MKIGKYELKKVEEPEVVEEINEITDDETEKEEPKMKKGIVKKLLIGTGIVAAIGAAIAVFRSDKDVDEDYDEDEDFDDEMDVDDLDDDSEGKTDK